ncbi:PREDICTED: uncharacterized protein LOC107351468 [Acropora digitifera]|uniref:uncharacterized protein LOC107351468 n=1 Tax=Acropora digitifera TaxID=70779 RepID=UPI00077A3BC5|nr:PREDICTED: uncharacterized protein LOC107351468 [Acropora digitifera]
MSEIPEYESKSKFAGRPTEKNANMSGKMQKSRKRKRASKPVRRVKKMRLEKELFLDGQETSKSKSILESEILPESRHHSNETCNNIIEIICLDSTSEQNNNEYIETIILDSTSEQKCDKKIEVINLDSTSEQKNNENIEIISLDSSLCFEFTDASWPTGENPFSLSGSCFTGQNSSSDESYSEDETPEFIKKLAPLAVFDDYEFGKMLGAGGFGQVIAATRKKDNLPVAIKFVHKSSVDEGVKWERNSS